jgi:hypothetical protein
MWPMILQTDSALAGATRGVHCEHMRHDSCDSIPSCCLTSEPGWNEAERSAKSEKRKRKRNGVRIQEGSQAIPAARSLRFCQRRQPEQQRAQFHAAIKMGRGAAPF